MAGARRVALPQHRAPGRPRQTDAHVDSGCRGARARGRCHVGPGCGSACPAGRPPLHPGTGSAAARPVPARCPQRDRGGDRFGKVLSNAVGAGGSGFGCCGPADSRRNPDAAGCLPTRAPVQDHAERGREAMLQVAASAAHHTVPNRVRSGLDPKPPGSAGCPGAGCRGRGTTARSTGPEPLRRCRGAPGRASRPAVHPAGPGRRRAIDTLGNQRDRRHPQHRPCILRPARSRARFPKPSFQPA